ncbi:hypothetical protein CROQUDRAFT_99181 [Cronartium quercuum f. sp. fusiforme G11]|uniref:Uncharacterized protein n=1 Tax=Cronartium quercuum f. sp. fusiforme G11 TaxID=708437 RepID=A0A9P6T6Q6_9BASI|nr:hypothetical protein CROQUDRAFT_99181 [Cronartium quercuum f. sp. fusiforme G11]
MDPSTPNSQIQSMVINHAHHEPIPTVSPGVLAAIDSAMKQQALEHQKELQACDNMICTLQSQINNINLNKNSNHHPTKKATFTSSTSKKPLKLPKRKTTPTKSSKNVPPLPSSIPKSKAPKTAPTTPSPAKKRPNQITKDDYPKAFNSTKECLFAFIQILSGTLENMAVFSTPEKEVVSAFYG